MPSDLTQLQTARTNLLALLVDLTENPKPNYSIDGQSVSWGDYLQQLLTAIKDIEDRIASEEGPFELETFGVPG